jgi:hypothetical protein
VDAIIREFSLYLASEGKKPRTITIYTDTASWFQRAQRIEDWTKVTRSIVREHMAFLNQNYSPGTNRQ